MNDFVLIFLSCWHNDYWRYIGYSSIVEDLLLPSNENVAQVRSPALCKDTIFRNALNVHFYVIGLFYTAYFEPF